MFHMALTVCFGMGLGVLLGLAIGAYLFSLMLTPKRYRDMLDLKADSDPGVAAPPQGTPISNEMRNLLEYTESWTHWPDSERVSMLNRVLSTLWPHITEAGLKTGLDIAKKQIAPMLKEIPYVEAVTLGNKTMADEELYSPAREWIQNKQFNVGDIPLRLGGIKSYDTPDDEVVLEIPILWGSDAKLDIGLFLKLGLLRLYVPLQISNLQMKVETRLTVKPLVETVPCVGGVTISLLKTPLVDMNLNILNGFDLLSLPFMRQGVQWALQQALGKMLIYPSSMSFPIMPQYGLPPVPKGALRVKLLRGENLPGDSTFVRLKTRGLNYQYGDTVRHQGFNPKYGQEFTLIIEDFEKQNLEVTLFQNRSEVDLTEQPKLGVGHVPFGKHEVVGTDPVTSQPKTEFVCEEFIRVPNEVMVTVPLQRPIHPHKLEVEQKNKSEKHGKISFSTHHHGHHHHLHRHRPITADAGKLYLKLTFLPFYQPEYDDDEDDASKAATQPMRRQILHNVPDHLQGVLTVNIIRCINLKGENPSTFVRVTLKQEESGLKDKVQTTQLVMGENNPRYAHKFDFVMIPANSDLIFTVVQKEGLQAESVFKKRKDAIIGALVLPVKDIARNGMLKDTWTLVDTERGQIELQLNWQTCYLNDD